MTPSQIAPQQTARRGREVLSLRACASLYAAIAAIYLLTSSGRIGGADQLAMFNVTQSLATHRGLSADPCTPDPTFNHCVPGVDGRNYAGFGLVPSITAVPAYPAARVAASLTHRNVQILAGLAVSLWHAMLAALVPVVLALWLSRIGLSPPIAVAAALIYAFASPAWIFSKVFYSEPYFVLGLLSCCYFLSGADRVMSLLIAGACFGFAIGSRIYGLILLPAVAGYGLMLWKSRERTWLKMFGNLCVFAVPIAVATGLIALSNQIRFGSVLKTGYHLNFPTTASLLHTPLLTGLRGLLLNWEVGLLWYVPWVLVIPFLWRRFWIRFRTEAVLVLGLTLTNLLFFAKYTAWHGGWSIGPRMLYAVIPFLVLPLAASFDHFTWRNLAGRLSIALIGVTLLIQGLFVLYPSSRYYTLDAFDRRNNLQPWWSGQPILEAVDALPELVFGIEPQGINAGHQYLLTFPNSINLVRADLWLLKASMLGIPRAVSLAIAAVLLLLFLWALRATTMQMGLRTGVGAAKLTTIPKD